MNVLHASPLLTDMYQLTMLQGYLFHGLRESAVFEFLCAGCLPSSRFLMAAGLGLCCNIWRTCALTNRRARVAWFDRAFRSGHDRLFALLRFTGDVDAMPEGTIFFASEPILRVVAPLPEAN